MKDSLETETVTVHQEGECFNIIVKHDQSGSAYGMQLSNSSYEQLRQHFVSDGLILAESQLPKRNENVIIKRKKQAVFYHGTDRDGICGIIKSKFIGTEYFDGWGVYLTTDKEDALNHGHYVLVFENLNVRIEKDDVNDGYLFRGKLNKDLVSRVEINPNDSRVIKDLLDGEVYWR